eukprot:86813_1
MLQRIRELINAVYARTGVFPEGCGPTNIGMVEMLFAISFSNMAKRNSLRKRGATDKEIYEVLLQEEDNLRQKLGLQSAQEAEKALHSCSTSDSRNVSMCDLSHVLVSLDP